MPNFPMRPNNPNQGTGGFFPPYGQKPNPRQPDNTGPMDQQVPNPMQQLQQRMGNRGTIPNLPPPPFQRQYGPNYGGGQMMQGMGGLNIAQSNPQQMNPMNFAMTPNALNGGMGTSGMASQGKINPFSSPVSGMAGLGKPNPFMGGMGGFGGPRQY